MKFVELMRALKISYVQPPPFSVSETSDLCPPGLYSSPGRMGNASYLCKMYSSRNDDSKIILYDEADRAGKRI